MAVERDRDRRLVVVWGVALLVLVAAGAVQGVAVDRATEGIADPSLIEAARRSTTPTMTLVVSVTTLVVWSACLYSVASLRRFPVATWRILVIAAAGGVLTIAPTVGWLIALIVLVVFVRWWLAAGWTDTAVVVVGTALLEAAATMPVYLGYTLAMSLLS